MKALIDTNVILDVLCSRKSFVKFSSIVWKYCEVSRIKGYISALSVPDIVYILRKELTPEKTKQVIDTLFLIFNVADLRVSDLKKAGAMKSGDYEDALQMICAERIRADYIVTRNTSDFAGSRVPVITPYELIGKLQ